MSLLPPHRALYAQLTEACRSYFGAETTYVLEYDDSGAFDLLSETFRAEGGGRLVAGFQLQGGRLLIGADAAELISRFASGEFTSGDPSKRSYELRQLRQVRAVLDALIHENVHAIGPHEMRGMRAEWATQRYPHVPAFSEGIAELAAQTCGGDILLAAGFCDIDPRIAVVGSSDQQHAFPGATSAAREFLRTVAELTGSTTSRELAAIIRDGSAKLAVDNVVVRIMAAQGLASLPQGRSVVAFMRLTRLVEDAFSSVATLPLQSGDSGFRRQFARQRMVQLRRDLTQSITELRGGTGPQLAA